MVISFKSLQSFDVLCIKKRRISPCVLGVFSVLNYMFAKNLFCNF